MKPLSPFSCVLFFVSILSASSALAYDPTIPMTPPQQEAMMSFNQHTMSIINHYKKELESFNKGEIPSIDFDLNDLQNVWNEGSSKLTKFYDGNDNFVNDVELKEKEYLKVREQLKQTLVAHPAAVSKVVSKIVPEVSTNATSSGSSSLPTNSVSPAKP